MKDPSGDGFPHGLEVQVVGPDYNRRVMVHLALASGLMRQPAAFSHMRSHVMLAVQ